jgi:hypothetical protein
MQIAASPAVPAASLYHVKPPPSGGGRIHAFAAVFAAFAHHESPVKKGTFTLETA